MLIAVRRGSPQGQLKKQRIPGPEVVNPPVLRSSSVFGRRADTFRRRSDTPERAGGGVLVSFCVFALGRTFRAEFGSGSSEKRTYNQLPRQVWSGDSCSCS